MYSCWRQCYLFLNIFPQRNKVLKGIHTHTALEKQKRHIFLIYPPKIKLHTKMHLSFIIRQLRLYTGGMLCEVAVRHGAHVENIPRRTLSK